MTIHPFLMFVGGIVSILLLLLIFVGTSIFQILLFFGFLAVFLFLAAKVLLFAFSIDVVAGVSSFFDKETNTLHTDASIIVNEEVDPTAEASPASVPEIKISKQVFNIPSNNFTYKDAKAVCSAYGARLAKYQEVEDAYNNGGEWCNYGWSQDQLALFPTQSSTYKTLQSIKGHENDCGRPGVNGGYIANPYVRFGVNCFGYKPEITSAEQEMMEHVSAPYPMTKEDVDFENRVNFYKNNIDNILVSPFNSSYWSKLL